MPGTASLSRRLAGGETVYCGWCSLGDPLAAETIAREGYPAIVLDMQHGMWDLAGAAAGIAAVIQAGAAPLLRPPLHDYAMASRALDFGAEGIIAPMINTAGDARALVAATKFPPRGDRSWGPVRALALAGVSADDYLRDADAATVTLAMIETRNALDNLDAIAGTDGIDALFVGPNDLSIALSDGRVLDQTSSDVDRGLDRVAAAAARAGKVAGAYCPDVERALVLARRGFRILSIGGDVGFLRAGAAAALARALKG